MKNVSNRWALVAALCVCAVSAPAFAQRAPYLQQGTPDAMSIAWRTASSSDSVVCWGDRYDSLVVTATGPSGVYDHVVQITGLEPDTRYYYAVSTTGSCPPASPGDDRDYFRTAPPVGSALPFTMWVAGDSGTGGSRQAQVFDVMVAEVGSSQPDLFLHMGDMAYSDGTDSEFTAHFFAPYAEMLRNTVVWPTMGNHEGHTSMAGPQTGPYYEAYVLPIDGAAGGMPSGTEAYYSFDYANVHFVVLESHQSNRDVDGAMLRWLVDDLASASATWLISFWHHPPYTDGSHDSDSEGALVQMRENALPILEAAGVDLVLGGHSHIYERSYFVNGGYETPTTASGIVDMGDGNPTGDGAYDATGDGAVYVVAGHGGTGVSGSGAHPLMYFSEVANGSCLIDVSGDTLTLRNLRYDGVETDRVTLVKGDGIYIVTPNGGETYPAGSVVDIVWTSRNAGTEVNLSFSLDDGRSWTPIVDATPNDGNHAWTTPRVASNLVRVRVVDAADTTVFPAAAPRADSAAGRAVDG